MGGGQSDELKVKLITNRQERDQMKQIDCMVVVYSQMAIAHAQLTGSSERNDVV